MMGELNRKLAAKYPPRRESVHLVEHDADRASVRSKPKQSTLDGLTRLFLK